MPVDENTIPPEVENAVLQTLKRDEVLVPDTVESEEEVAGSDVETPEVEQPEATDVEEASTEEEAIQPTPHRIKFRRNEKDEEYELKYDADGKLAEESVSEFRKLLEKEGLEVKAQRAIEDKKEIERQLAAERARVEMLNKELAPAKAAATRWDEFSKTPQAVALYNQQRIRNRQEPIDPARERQAFELAARDEENKQLKAREAYREAEQFMIDVSTEFMGKYGDVDVETCSAIIKRVSDNGFQFDPSRPLYEQRSRILGALDMGRNAFIGEGKLRDPRLVEAERKQKEMQDKLDATKKRQAARNPSAGGGAVQSKGNSGEVDLRNLSMDDWVRLNKQARN